MKSRPSKTKLFFCIKFFFIQWLVISSLFACDKDNNNPNDNPGNDTTDTPDLPVPFDKVPTLKDMVIYEVNFMAFGPYASINDVLSRIDSIKSLGVNVLWLMPIFPEGQLNGVGSPYCVQDYKEVNPDLGTLNDLKEFVVRAHELEMAVILDWVANHTSWDNNWILNTDWYSQDSQGNIISPPGTGWNDVADLNYDSPLMRLEMIRSMKYWITTCNIDGFRCDAADFVPYDFWKQAIDSLKNLPGRDLILLAEGSRNDHFTAGFQMTYAWDFQSTLKNIFYDGADAGSIYQINTNEYSAIPAGNERLRYITNHDIYAWDASPVVHFVSDEGSLSAFMAVAFMGGVPLICSGQEVANSGNISFFEPNPVNWSQHTEILSTYKKIMSIRKSLPEIRDGSLSSYSNSDVLVFKRTGDDNETLILANVRNTSVMLTLPVELSNTQWTDQWENTDLSLGTEIELDPFEFILARRTL